MPDLATSTHDRHTTPERFAAPDPRATGPLYVTSSIPYVNAPPHLGHALELVQVDTLARHARAQHRPVRWLTGTDEHSLKNVRAAQAEGVPTAELVARNAARFQALQPALELAPDDFIRTSADPRHAPGVVWLWRAWQRSGDLYRRRYRGHYCVGCEQFYDLAEAPDGACPEHHTPLEVYSETNWFFRLSRYTAQLTDAIAGGRLDIQPAQRRNEVLALLAGGLSDISVSRSVARAHGWGIGVPGDPGQVVYVWIDALANYLTALGVGGPSAEAVGAWWEDPGGQRVHVIGKGILRFHAVYWPALLASAGQALPTRILVHDYLTVAGRKIAKSDPATGIDPAALAAEYGADAVRWWLLADVGRVGDTDFTAARLREVYDRDLAGGIGNLASRVATLVWRARGGQVPPPGPDPDAGPAAWELGALRGRAGARIAAHVAGYDLRGAAGVIRELVGAANRYAEAVEPWRLARAEAAGDPQASGRLEVALGNLVAVCREIAGHLRPFLPGGADRLAAALAADNPSGGPLPPPVRVFPRLPQATGDTSGDTTGDPSGGH